MCLSVSICLAVIRAATAALRYCLSGRPRLFARGREKVQLGLAACFVRHASAQARVHPLLSIHVFTSLGQSVTWLRQAVKAFKFNIVKVFVSSELDKLMRNKMQNTLNLILPSRLGRGQSLN